MERTWTRRWRLALAVLWCISAEGADARGLLGVAAAAATPGAEGSSDDAVNSAIAYGLLTAEKDFQYLVSLLDSADSWAGCGGALIRPRLAITAAHCVKKANGKISDVKAVYIGIRNWETDMPSQYEYRKVTKIVVHGQYNPDTLANDIALLVLNRPAKTKPVLLPPPTYKLIPADVYEDGDWLFVAGFGSTEQGDTSRLLYAEVPFISRAYCNEIYIDEFESDPVPTTHICAGYADDSQDSCEGDSGGPLVKRTKNGDVLVGVVSYGPGGGSCGGDMNLGAYTSVTAMRRWLLSIIASLKL